MASVTGGDQVLAPGVEIVPKVVLNYVSEQYPSFTPLPGRFRNGVETFAVYRRNVIGV